MDMVLVFVSFLFAIFWGVLGGWLIAVAAQRPKSINELGGLSIYSSASAIILALLARTTTLTFAGDSGQLWVLNAATPAIGLWIISLVYSATANTIDKRVPPS